MGFEHHDVEKVTWRGRYQGVQMVMTVPWLDLLIANAFASEKLFPGCRQRRGVSGYAGDAILLRISTLPPNVR